MGIFKKIFKGIGKVFKKIGKGIKGAKKLSFTNILFHNGKITAKKFLNARLKAEEVGFKTY